MEIVKHPFVDLTDILKRVPLEDRIRIVVEVYALGKCGGSVFVPLGEDGEPNREVENINCKILKETEELLDLLLTEIREWKKDVGME